MSDNEQCDKLEKYKKNRTVLRGSCTRLSNQIDSCLKSENLDFDTLEENIDQLNIKYESLMKIDDKSEPLVKAEEYDSEVSSVYEYRDKITLMLFRGRKKLKDNEKRSTSFSNDSSNISERSSLSHSKSEPVSENKFVKLPKLTIPKYFGQITQYLDFWNTFKASIHKNPGLSKIQKFNYLRSYLGGPAAMAIEGFEITDDNYDAALKILEERFGSKDLIIQEHFDKLLNLTPVYKLNDISKLRKMHNEIETNVRSLSSLGIKAETYSPMLTAVILKNIPSVLTLEFNRKNVNNSNTDIFELLYFIQTEIKVRERSFFHHNSGFKEPDCSENKPYWKNPKSVPSTHEFVAVAEEKSKPNNKSNEESFVDDGTDNVISAVSHMGNKNRTLLQTSYVLAKNGILDSNCGTRVLLDCGSMRSFTTQNIANKLKCQVLRKEKLSVYTFGSKIPIEKQYDVIKLTLINRNSPDLKIEIEALVTNEISGSNIPPPKVEDFKGMKRLKNMTLADFPESKEPITILIIADYYYNVVTGNIKHLSKSLVAVETIFGWCLQGKKSENNISLMMNVVVKDSVISEQNQKFWDLETSGLVDSKQDTDKPFRILLDLTELHVEGFKYVWINASPREMKTISDLKSDLLKKLNLKRHDIKLFVRDGLLLDE
ncbi:uncharacterized protein LOC129218845 [Uloborus diversus]|uniref:uncharacterized protein LOC129218845 n=1 Tax=Uloborus diversus TaxID=327109 RepID=UPI002409FDEA|nr:uncharacterized protein LOC129218845 [Uloborus diversus]